MFYAVKNENNELTILTVENDFQILSFHTTLDEAIESAQRIRPDFDAAKWLNVFNTGNSIRCVETGHIYETMTECAKALNVQLSQVSRHINDPDKFKTLKGLTFVRV